MPIRNILLVIGILLLNQLECLGQFKNSIWCFGDSAGINFINPQSPVVFKTSVNSRGSCVSISDDNDSLLFYAYTRAAMAGNTGLVYNRDHLLMANGNNIHGEGWYHEMLIIPFPGDIQKFYLITNGVTGSSALGLKYSVIDLSFNNGLGEVVQKNISLQTFPIADGITALKHGNGRDWWVIFRPADPINMQNWTNTFYTYLITPSGISNLMSQNIGTLFISNLHRLKSNKVGNKIVAFDAGGMIELYDFDRCTGLFSNAVNISPVSSAPFPFYWDAEFSPSGRYLYVSSNPDTSYIIQYDLSAPNITASKDTIWSTTFPEYTGGHFKIAPDSNIYYATTYYDGFQFPYPYADSVYNMYNMNLGIIHEPDSAGSACNFQPWSFYLGGFRTYGGLPNNPDYEMEASSGSPCDSLTGITEFEKQSSIISVFYQPTWQIAFVNLSNLRGRQFHMHIYDLSGKIIYEEKGKLNSSYFTRDVKMIGKSNGMYVIRFETEKEVLSAKFVTQ